MRSDVTRGDLVVVLFPWRVSAWLTFDPFRRDLWTLPELRAAAAAEKVARGPAGGSQRTLYRGCCINNHPGQISRAPGAIKIPPGKLGDVFSAA